LNYITLPQNNKVIVEFVWIGGSGHDLRSKCKTYNVPINSVTDLAEWNFDGSSTNQANTQSSEILIVPVALFNDPFRGGDNKIALCETFNTNDEPTVSNFRYFAKKIFDQDKGKHDPWFGIEQEFTIMQTYGTGLKWPLGWPLGNFTQPQGPFYCSVGSGLNYGREVSEAHYRVCLAAGVKIFGTNAEVMPGQWEFQIGTGVGIETADHLWMARYLLQRTSEYFGLDVSFEPKPIAGDWNGAGCHTNFSTSGTRSEGGYKYILENHIKKA